MKIEILSMQNVDNYGSILQSYALKKNICLYNEISFLKIKNGTQSINTIELAPEKEKTIKINKYIVNNIVQILQRKKIKSIFNDFRKKYFAEANVKENYDLCIIGSDEVFNCLQKSNWGFTTQLFGEISNANRIITYAASCGYTKYELLSQKMIGEINNSLKKITEISVRDENTYIFISKISNIEPIYHLDPVLVTGFDDEIEKECLPKYLEKKYCVIYSYKNRIYLERDIIAIKEFCKKNGLEIISLGATQKWIRKHIYAEPFELLKIFKESSYVITDTFHGTIFAAKYAKKVAIMIKDSNRNKLEDLVNRLNIKDHVISDYSELDKNYSIELNRKAIDDIIEKERIRTLDYLKKYTNE